MSYQEKITNEEAEMILSHQPCNDVVTSRDDFKMLYGIASQLSSDLLAARKERDTERARADKAEAKIREMRESLERIMTLGSSVAKNQIVLRALESTREYTEENGKEALGTMPTHAKPQRSFI